eukprot:823771_1
MQVYTPEDLLEMIISLKDKLLPLMTSKNGKTNGKTAPIRTRSNSHPKSPPTSSWPSNNAPTMSYIKEDDEYNNYGNHKNNGSSVHWNVQVNSPKKKSSKIQHGLYWSGS